MNVSSTKIRKALKEGDVELASTYLGTAYTISGTVVKGKQIGRTLGFPTANIHYDFKHKLLPADGVYAGILEYNGQRFKAMANLGARPTLNSEHRILEVHCIGEEIELYNSDVQFEFRSHLRDIQDFHNLDALKEQLEIDKKGALTALAQ